MWLLLGLSLVAGGVFVERLLFFRRASVDLGPFLEGLANLIRQRHYAEAVQHCALTPGPVARVLQCVLSRHHLARSELRDIAREAGQLEVPALERSLGILLGIAYLSPLVGLLGTLLGLLDTFDEIHAASGFSTSASLAEGIYTSLLTSAGGIAVAVPAYLLFTFLSSRARSIMHAIERASIEVLQLLADNDARSDIVEFRPRIESESSTGPAR
jgi:biopolymer transport protein ExbB